MKPIIAFAQHGGYFISGPGYRRIHNLPDWFKETMSKALEVYCVAFGPGDAAVVTYLDAQTGCVQLRIKNIASMRGLAEYLLDRNPHTEYKRHLRHLQVSFSGRGGSYWASDGQTSIYRELPEQLELDLRMLQTERGAWRDSTRCVVLGAGGNYVLLTGRGASSCQLGSYPGVFHTMNAVDSAPTGIGSIWGIHLDSFRGSSVVQCSDGSLHGFDLSPEARRDIAQINRQVHAAQAAYCMAQEQLRQDLFQAQVMQQAMFVQEEAALKHMFRKQLENQQWCAEMSARAGGVKWVEGDGYGRPK
ncbi:hypothetical protein ISF_05006 [Cordyceps fumosorosea ARSEF 2679]|uniref:Uncharacterized protein n=1 Tax=Cordyceps fumosorosea (strain ARSEF 2679) TaxID=1081104 RepID=A0A167VYT8_CORFA|nr:hypothetical protein ISF_05006 [Cordyceps fumosorosea ARSEF 2679]OAA63130.1 hypothetical protein ISF_05006 [Cordyceps fumosorosea ARSEF 2679]